VPAYEVDAGEQPANQAIGSALDDEIIIIIPLRRPPRDGVTPTAGRDA
jgi:hypothetical protein